MNNLKHIILDLKSKPHYSIPVGTDVELFVIREWMLSYHSHETDSHNTEITDDSPLVPNGSYLTYRTKY